MYGVELLNVRQCESVLHECDGLLRSQQGRREAAEYVIRAGVGGYVNRRGYVREKDIARARARLANDIRPRLAALTDWRQALADRLKVTLVDAF